VWSAKESSSIAIVLSFFTLCVATNSLLMAGLASLTILVTLIFVLGWLVFLGWDLGVLESMCMAICVGTTSVTQYKYCDRNSELTEIYIRF
jgi:hypothetical protein